MEGKGYWALPQDLQILHDAIIEYGVEIQSRGCGEVPKETGISR